MGISITDIQCSYTAVLELLHWNQCSYTAVLELLHWNLQETMELLEGNYLLLE